MLSMQKIPKNEFTFGIEDQSISELPIVVTDPELPSFWANYPPYPRKQDAGLGSMHATEETPLVSPPSSISSYDDSLPSSRLLTPEVAPTNPIHWPFLQGPLLHSLLLGSNR